MQNFSSILHRLARYRADGTLRHRIAARFGFPLPHVKVKWYGASSETEAIRALSLWARVFSLERKGIVLCPGPGDRFHTKLVAAIRNHKLDCLPLTLEELEAFSEEMPVSVVISGFRDTCSNQQVASLISSAPALAELPFEYAAGIDPFEDSFHQWDEYQDTFFVSPTMLPANGPYHHYAESLKYFEQKCGIRDFLDLYQMLCSIGERGIDGAIAEFGSFKGHSGWLMARSLRALGQKRDIYLFDMFEQFPNEEHGIDKFWSETHAVDFEAVRSQFTDFDNVELVQGDFTRTLAQSDIGPIALAYVDCDSYRATRYLFDELLEKHLVPGGVLICEDYGHPALLGSRLAVHEVLDGRRDLVRWHSQFSGLYIAVKIA